MSVPSSFRLQTLGSLRLFAPDGCEVPSLVNRRQKLALLALLAITRKPMSRDQLVDLFWGDRSESRARHSLSDALSQLRGALGQSAIRTRQSEIVLSERAAIHVDLLELADAAVARDWGRVVQLYAAPFLDGVHIDGAPEWEHWVLTQRQGAEQIFLRACRHETARLEDAGSWSHLEEVSRRWLLRDALDAVAARRYLTAIARRDDGASDAPRRLRDAFDALALRALAEHGQSLDASVTACRDALLRDLVQPHVAGLTPPLPPQPAALRSPPLPTTPLQPAPSHTWPQDTVGRRTPSRSPASRVRWIAMAAIVGIVVLALGIAERKHPGVTDRTDTPEALAQQLVDRALTGAAAQVSRSEAIALLERAVSLDATNATAYRTLALLWEGDGTKRVQVAAALTSAASLADRVPAQEREAILSSYHLLVTGDFVQAAEHQRALLQLDSRDPDAWHDLGMTYQYLGDDARAAEAYRQALVFDPSSASTWANLVDAVYATGDAEGAAAAIDAMALAIPGHPSVFSASARLLAASGELQAAEQQARAYLAATAARPRAQGIGEMLLSRILWTQGRVAEGDAAARRGIERQVEVGDAVMALRESLALASTAFWLRNDAARTRRITSEALTRFPLDGMAEIDRPYLELATVQALGEDLVAARRSMERYADSVPASIRRRMLGTEALARGTIEWRSSRLDDAVTLLRDASTPDCPACGLPELALVYAAMGESESAAAAARRFLSFPTLRRTDLLDALHRRRLEARRPRATD